MEIWIIVEAFLTDNAVLLGGGAATITIVEVIFSPFRTFAQRFQKPQKVEVIEPATPPNTLANPRLDIVSFLSIQKHLRAELTEELETAHAEAREELQAKIADLTKRIENPDAALKEAQTRIDQLEQLLERDGNQIGGERLNAAREALEAGDYTLADDIFAEIETRGDLEVQATARAAYGRGTGALGGGGGALQQSRAAGPKL